MSNPKTYKEWEESYMKGEIEDKTDYKLLILCATIDIKNISIELHQYHVVATQENENQFNIVKNKIDGTFPILNREELEDLKSKHKLIVEYKE